MDKIRLVPSTIVNDDAKVILVPLTKLQIKYLRICKTLFDDSKDMDEVAEYLTPIFEHLDKCLIAEKVE